MPWLFFLHRIIKYFFVAKFTEKLIQRLILSSVLFYKHWFNWKISHIFYDLSRSFYSYSTNCKFKCFHSPSTVLCSLGTAPIIFKIFTVFVCLRLIKSSLGRHQFARSFKKDIRKSKFNYHCSHLWQMI